MESPHRSALIRIVATLAVGLWLAWPAWAWPQSITATLVLSADPHAVAINKATNKIYVASGTTKQTSLVTIIDGTTHATMTVQVGMWPLAVAVNETTNKIYVANYGDLPLGIPGSITVIDGATNSTTPIIDPNASHPRAVAVNPSTNKIYVANFWSGNVTVVDGATNSTTTVTDPNANGLDAFAVAVDPVTNKIYVANNNIDRAGNNPGNVTVIDGTTNSTNTVTDPNAFGPNAVAVNAVTNKVYVTNGGAYPAANHGNVTIIDGATNSTTTVTDPNALAPQAVAVNKTTNKIYVANANNSAISWKGVVTVIDGATHSATTVIDPNAEFPDAVAVDEATNRIYVSNGGCGPGPGTGCNNAGSNPGSITVINGATNSVSAIIDPKANGPGAVAGDPVTDQIYVANGGSGNLTITDGSGMPLTHTLALLLPGSGTGSVTSNPSGIDCGTSCTASFATGTAVRLSALAAPGSEFSGWGGPCVGSSTCDLMATADQFVTATFKSTAPMQVVVPNVVGQTQAAATMAITAAGLVVGGVTQQSSSTVASGYVISESPPDGTDVTSGSAVDLAVSSGSSTGGGGYGGGGAIDSLTVGALLSALMAALRRVQHRSARSLSRGRTVWRGCPTSPDAADINV
jgi:DNA-binding beta-propeller fold protein YncE